MKITTADKDAKQKYEKPRLLSEKISSSDSYQAGCTMDVTGGTCGTGRGFIARNTK